ncbi:MAG TPA: DUF5131 family protein [Bryobacteraceae bacterium]|nr:DUF5131 family protein [Bryobacteraceae bacterium]
MGRLRALSRLTQSQGTYLVICSDNGPPSNRTTLGEFNWMIVGGESGRGARPMQEDWVQSLRRQCRHQRVRFFFKQWGSVNKKASGWLLNDRTYDELPVL